MRAHKLSPAKIPLAKLSPRRVPFAPGVYIMYRTNMGAPAYVGRDDNRLYDAIDSHRSRGNYRYFKFMRCDNAADAFQWECMFWHKGQPSIDNAESRGGRHPKPPVGSDLACPYPGCSHVLHEPVAAPSEEAVVTEAAFAQHETAEEE